MGSAARAGRLERRQRRGGGRRPGGRGTGGRWSGIDSDTGGVVRAVRPEAPARSCLDEPARGALARPDGLRRADTLGGRHGAVSRCGRGRHGRRSRPRSGARDPVRAVRPHAARAAAHRAVHAHSPGHHSPAGRGRGARAATDRRAAALAGARGLRARPGLRARRAPGRARPLPARDSRRCAGDAPSRSPGTAHALAGASGCADSTGAVAALAGRRGGAGGALEGRARGPRRAADPSHRDRRPAHRPAAGPRCAVDAEHGRRLGALQRDLERHRPARVLGARGVRRRRARRARCSSWAGQTTRRRCSSLAAQIEAERPWAQARPPEFS